MSVIRKLTAISIKKKFIFMGAAMGVVPVIIMAFVSFQIASSEIQNEAFAKLEAVRDIKKSQIEKYFQNVINDVSVLSSIKEITELRNEVKEYHDFMELSAEDLFPTETESYKEIWNRHSGIFTNYIATKGYNDLYII